MTPNTKNPSKKIFAFICLSMICHLLVAQSQTPRAIDSTSLVLLKEKHFRNLPLAGDRIKIPQIENHTISLIGSDNSAVVDLQGIIHQPLVTKNVNLLFKVVRETDDATAEIPVKDIRIKGKYSNNGVGEKPFVIPSLREWYGKEGVFKLRKTSRIILADTKKEALNDAANLLQEDLQKLTGRRFEIRVGKPVAGDIHLSESRDTVPGEEGYFLDIDDVFRISAPAYKGIVFGTRTLLQLLAQSPKELAVPKGQSRDYPTYAVRGFMLDVGRKFFSIDFLNDYVEIMSFYKMSNFQIHLNDNSFSKYYNFDWSKTPSGFRLENATYPGLASKDGFYTKEQFKDLQKKAARFGITIIPEIDVPAHSLAIVKAVPEIGSERYGKDHLDLDNPKTMEVVRNIFDEYTKGPDPVFIGDEVHIGTDEYDKKEAEKFRAFTDFLIRHVQGNGKTVRAWGALTHAKGTTPVTAKNVTLNAWYNGYADPLEMKQLGYKQISTPDGWLYIVPAAGYYYDFLNVNNIYNHWEPRVVGNITFEKGDPAIVGGMFAVWNDISGNGISEKDVHNRIYPALQALSEKMWSAQDENTALFDFNQKKLQMIEAPGMNLRGAFPNAGPLLIDLDFDKNYTNRGTLLASSVKADDLQFKPGFLGESLYFNNKSSYFELPIEEIGTDYTVSFWVNPEAGLSGPLFSSKNATVDVDKERLSYTRDGYTFSTNSILKTNEWSFVTVTGNLFSTRFYVNGRLVSDMSPEEITLPYNDRGGKPISYKKVKTLTFPLKKISFPFSRLDELKIYNKQLTADEISNAYTSDRHKAESQVK